MRVPKNFRVLATTQEQGRAGRLAPLVFESAETPALDAGQVLMKIAYAGVNRPDILQRKGLYAPPKGASDVLGLEASGVVVARGANVRTLSVGQKICGLLHGGGYGEYALVEEEQALPVPQKLSLLEAAALPETYFTVWSNVFMRGRLQAGERFLVHGGSSGIGTTAIQLAHAFGARVFATAGSDKKCRACEELGAERAINYKRDDFVEVLKEEGGANVILDMVGGAYIAHNLKALADGGRLCLIAFLEGAKAEVNFAEIMMRRLEITGSTLRPRTVREKALIARALYKHVWPLLEEGRVKPIIDRVFSLSEAEKAHEYMLGSTHIGKIMLCVDARLG